MKLIKLAKLSHLVTLVYFSTKYLLFTISSKVRGTFDGLGLMYPKSLVPKQRYKLRLYSAALGGGRRSTLTTFVSPSVSESPSYRVDFVCNSVIITERVSRIQQ